MRKVVNRPDIARVTTAPRLLSRCDATYRSEVEAIRFWQDNWAGIWRFDSPLGGYTAASTDRNLRPLQALFSSPSCPEGDDLESSLSSYTRRRSRWFIPVRWRRCRMINCGRPRINLRLVVALSGDRLSCILRLHGRPLVVASRRVTGLSYF